ncbi:MAG: hypothetical protein KAY50_03770 [Chitinophagaceae bacterium]|nr:hypothetical protein [Chitinophagaceae bacterium]
MKKNTIISMLPFLVVMMFINYNSTFAQVKIPLKLKPYIKTNKVPAVNKLPPVDSLKKQIDPAAKAINFSVVSRIDNLKAKVKIEGVVKNIGRDDFKSTPNRQVILLYEKNPGGASNLVATQSFQNLAKDAEIKTSFIREWDKSIEFPPSYILIISYDPDIYLDGNPDNNDTNSINNKMEKSSTGINTMKW